MPLYEFKCPRCDFHDLEFRVMEERNLPVKCRRCEEPMVRNFKAEAAGPHLDREFHKPIEMHSLGLDHPADIREFQKRNPGVDISTDPDDELYGVPIARSRRQKLTILKNEGYQENN